MFSVFPDGTQPVKKKTSPWVWIAAGCGGCTFLVILSVVGFSYFAYNKSKGMIQDMIQQPTIAKEMLTALQNHQYEAASGLFKPTSQAKYTPEALKTLIESKEHKLGKITSIRQSEDAAASAPASHGIITTYRSQIIFENGKLNAVVSFRSDDPLHPVKGVSDLELNAISDSKIKVQGQQDGDTSPDMNTDSSQKEPKKTKEQVY